MGFCYYFFLLFFGESFEVEDLYRILKNFWRKSFPGKNVLKMRNVRSECQKGIRKSLDFESREVQKTKRNLQCQSFHQSSKHFRDFEDFLDFKEPKEEEPELNLSNKF